VALELDTGVIGNSPRFVQNSAAETEISFYETLKIRKRGAGAPNIFIDSGGSSGNVGIGTTGPASKLEVAGKVTVSSGSDAPLNVPVLTSDPGSPSTGDVWIRKVAGTPNTYFLKVQTSDGPKAVQVQ
jgi:hypothetical protein